MPISLRKYPDNQTPRDQTLANDRVPWPVYS